MFLFFERNAVGRATTRVTVVGEIDIERTGPGPEQSEWRDGQKVKMNANATISPPVYSEWAEMH